MTIGEYYSSYKSALGYIAGFVAATPLLSLIPISIDNYFFPPLGDMGLLARIFSVALVILASLLAYYLEPVRYIRAIVLLIVGSFLVASVYASLYFLFVRKVPIPSLKSTAYVSVGYTKTAFAVKAFPDNTDEEMLAYRGLSDEEVRHLWNPLSVVVVRLGLWWTCTLSLAFAVMAVGVGITAENTSTVPVM